MTTKLGTAVVAALKPDPREGKLPQWAQNLLRVQREVVRETKAYADAALLTNPVSESDAVLRPYGEPRLGLGPIGLGPYVTVRFPLVAQDDYHSPYVDVRLGAYGRAVEIHTGDRLVMQPVSGNAIRVFDRRTP